MEHKLIITSSAFYIKEEVNKLKSELTMPDFNYLNVTTKLPAEEITDMLIKMPLMDRFKLIVFDISLYSKTELKEILSTISDDNYDNSSNVVIAIYYLKDKLDKLDSATINLFKKNNFVVDKLKSINKKIVSDLLKENNLKLNPVIFENHDNMDVVINDISKLSFLNQKDLAEDNIHQYLSESFDSNVFELIDYVVNKDVTNALKKLELLLVSQKGFVLNLLILKHLILLRLVKQGMSGEKVAAYEKFSGGKGSINPYRLSLLKKSNPKINLDFAIGELLNNDKIKTFNLEMSLLKIFSN